MSGLLVNIHAAPEQLPFSQQNSGKLGEVMANETCSSPTGYFVLAA
jgi:hypothetical protein